MKLQRMNIFVSLSVFICYFLSVFARNVDYSEILGNIRTNTNESIQSKAAYDVITRTIGASKAANFMVKVDFNMSKNSFKLFKNELTTNVTITAASGVAACKGFYYYIKYYCNGHISWEGSQLNIQDVLPNVNIDHKSPSLFIYYQNVCTWSYSFAWWKWQDWQKHIDWMAMQGITLALAPVQELVWSQVYAELGLTNDEIYDHLAGPGFLAWQRMGNIRGWGGPVSKHFKKFSSRLQVKMIRALRNLGIAVALPAFAGHVPRALQRIFPNSTMTDVQRWNRFTDKYCCPLFIDPVDPLFQKIGQTFLEKIIQKYSGTDHIYFSDPFNEVLPRSPEPSYLASASKGIYNTIESVDANGVWLLQGWMFVNEHNYWADNMIEAFLTGAPLGKILVLDLQSEQSPQYERTHSFYGQPFIWCMLHNFGGTLGMHGSVDILNKRIKEAYEMPNSTMYGVGITPEGINQNYIIYEFALEKAWDYEILDAGKWFSHYAAARYGQHNIYANLAWNKLLHSVYAYSGNETLRGKYIVCKRPSLDLKTIIWYDPTDIDDAWRTLLLVADKLRNSDLYKHDLVDVIRQFIQIKFEEYYVQLIDAFTNEELKIFHFVSQQMVEILIDLDRILASNGNFLLGRWIESAKNLSTNAIESQLYEINARNQITTWGPNGQIVDYAMKQWSGMVSDYCLPRWKLFFKIAEETLSQGQKKFNMAKFRRQIFTDIEAPFTTDNKMYPKECNGDTVEIAKELYIKYGGGSLEL